MLLGWNDGWELGTWDELGASDGLCVIDGASEGTLLGWDEGLALGLVDELGDWML